MERIDASRLAAAAAALGDAIPVTPALVDAWRQLHYAAQVAAEVGKSWAAPQPDDSHSNFELRDGWLLGAVIPSPRPFRAALGMQDLALRLAAEDGATLAAHDLDGATLGEATSWVRAQAALFAREAARQPAVPAPDLPAHAVAQGARFAGRDRAAFADLARLLIGADTVLREVAASVPGAPPVRIWPHHFDVAMLVALAPGRTIGVGLAAPESIAASGYWYVSPWAAQPSAAPATSWPSLAHGRFVDRGASLRMAVLPLDAWSRIEKHTERECALATFLVEAIAISAANLGS